MRQVFLWAFLLVRYCALVTAPTTSAIYKVEVLDVIWKNLFKIISFNTPYVSLSELWSNIYQIPYIAQRRSIPSNSKYIQLTIVTPGQPHIKINNETPAPPNNRVYVANSVIILSVSPSRNNILCVTKDEGESGKSTNRSRWKMLPKSKASAKTLVSGKKSIILDFIVSSETRTTVNANYIWREANWRIEASINDSSAEFSVWHNVYRILVKAYDYNGKATTDIELLKNSTRRTQQQLNSENGVIYVDLKYRPRPGSELGVKHIVPLWISMQINKDNYVGVFRFVENTTKRSIWQKLKNYLSNSRYYSEWRLVEVRIEMIGIENLVITVNDENDTTSPVNFEKAITVVFTVRRFEVTRTPVGNRLGDMLNIVIPRKPGFSEVQLTKLPQVKVTQEMTNETCSICLNEFQEKEQVTELQCGHFFHRDCAKPWLAIKTECPLCRNNLSNWDFTLPPKKDKEIVDEKKNE